MKAKHEMTNATKNTNAKRNTKSRETPSILLKTLHDDIMRDNANATITTKRMRVWLRANMRECEIKHERNATWIFTQSQYDIVRSHFDAKYRERIERAAKRANATHRKRNAKSNVETTNATNDETQRENA